MKSSRIAKKMWTVNNSDCKRGEFASVTSVAVLSEDRMSDMARLSFSSDHVNYLILRYLQESRNNLRTDNAIL